MRTYLGVDGGGSKTTFSLIDEAGDLLAETTGPSCYYFEHGIDLVEEVLGEGVATIAALSGIAPPEFSRSFFGLPGYGESSSDIQRLDTIAETVVGSKRVSCDNDMICGWAGSLGGADGINIISGTGSMTYGERAGRGHRAGGWGELFGDEGSAYWIAVRGLNAFTRMSDGRIPRGPLYDILKARLGLGHDLDLVGKVINDWQGRRTKIADLSKAVVEAAEGGDPVASKILSDACRELLEIIDATRGALDFPADEVVPLSYSGGMFTAPQLLGCFRTMLRTHSVDYELHQPLLGPGIGAALYAAKKAGFPMQDPAMKQLHRTETSRRKSS